jgi:hypothetical protein
MGVNNRLWINGKPYSEGAYDIQFKYGHVREIEYLLGDAILPGEEPFPEAAVLVPGIGDGEGDRDFRYFAIEFRGAVIAGCEEISRSEFDALKVKFGKAQGVRPRQ